MSYGNYGRYGSGYSSYRPGSYYSSQNSSSYVPSSYSRRSGSGLMPSLSSSYLSPNSSPRNSITSGTARDSRPSYGSYKTLTADSRRCDYSPERKLKTSKSTGSIQLEDLSIDAPSERGRYRYGSTSIPDIASDASSRSDTPSRYSSISSKSSLIDDDKDYRKLYEEVKKDNERLKENLKKTEEELDRTKKQLQKLSQNNTTKNSVSETEKKERRCLERKLSEMEEELKLIEKLKADNERLKDENGALIRVISKLSK